MIVRVMGPTKSGQIEIFQVDDWPAGVSLPRSGEYLDWADTKLRVMSLGWHMDFDEDERQWYPLWIEVNIMRAADQPGEVAKKHWWQRTTG